MQPAPDDTSDLARKHRNAGLLSSALSGEVTWSALPAKRKVGVILAMLGVITLPLSMVLGWIWALCGGAAIAIGSYLTYSGVELKDKSPWPPYSGY